MDPDLQELRMITTLMVMIQQTENKYVAVSASVIIWVPKSGESKSGQMVSEKVIWS